MTTDFETVRASYDLLAKDYAERFFDELDHKPLDRLLLDHLAEQVDASGTVADVGVDLSPSLVAAARTLNPDIEFRVGSMLDLNVDNATWADITAFYSIIHLDEDEVGAPFTEFQRVLRPGWRLLVAFHAGDEVRHADELWGHPVSLDFRFFDVSDIMALLEGAGFTVEAWLQRRPCPMEPDTRRAYVLAHTHPPENPGHRVP